MLTAVTLTQLLLPLFAQYATAQVLTSGNTQLPACASSCTLLNQAAAACGGATTSNQGIWSCFCQSAYLKSLYSSPAGICDAFCPDPAQNQQVMTWYTSECGTDNGVSAHAGGAQQGSTTQGGTTTTSAGTTTTRTGTTTTGTANTASGTAAAGTFVPIGIDPVQNGSWWENHYKWVIMLIVILLGLIALAFLFVWLKRRHSRRQDAVVGGFNEGITMRSTPMVSVPPAPLHSSSGRDSPVRTRDAFMPYGYGYARSESRLGSRTDLGEPNAKGSPLAHDGVTLAQLEKNMSDTGHSGKKKRVYVRERSISGRDSPEMGRR